MAMGVGVGTVRRAPTSKAPKVSGAPQMTSAMAKSDADYRAEDDFRTLERGEEVRGDTKRHSKALAHGRRKVASMAKILGRGRSASRR